MSAKPRPKKARRLKKSEGYVYRYHVSCCPECSQDFTKGESLRVVLAVAGANPEFMSHLGKDGVLHDPEKHVFRGSHSHTECGTCGFELWNYEDVLEPGEEDRPPPKLFPWSYDKLVALHEFGTGDVPDLSRKLAKYLVTIYHSELSYSEDRNLNRQAADLLSRVCQNLQTWAAKAQDAIEKWRADK